jgi:hypothetical protein
LELKARYRTFAEAIVKRPHAILARIMKGGPKNAFYAQSGGVTAVINASACGLIETRA